MHFVKKLAQVSLILWWWSLQALSVRRCHSREPEEGRTGRRSTKPMILAFAVHHVVEADHEWPSIKSSINLDDHWHPPWLVTWHKCRWPMDSRLNLRWIMKEWQPPRRGIRTFRVQARRTDVCQCLATSKLVEAWLGCRRRRVHQAVEIEDPDSKARSSRSDTVLSQYTI